MNALFVPSAHPPFRVSCLPVSSSTSTVSAPFKETLLPRPRVLIIDEDLAASQFISANLRDAGLVTDCAGGGVLGLRAFQANPPQLVLIDLKSPFTDSFEVCDSIRRNTHVPVLLMTTREESTHQTRSLRLGADDYILKPLDSRILVARVIAHLRRARRFYA